jgi:peptidoglycan/xylan/chitin deacetylase (PgdA/CDA1 family)
MVRLLICAALSVIACATAPLDRRGDTIVAVTFDDGDTSVYTCAFPFMRRLDPSWTATNYLCESYPHAVAVLSTAQLKEMETAGWETGGHGKTHDNFTSIPLDSVEVHVKASDEFLARNGLSHESFAYPFGNFNDEVQDIVGRYFRTIRSSHDQHYFGTVNPQRLGYFAVKGGHTANDIIARVEEARIQNEPLVVIGFHVILPDTSVPVPVYYCRESAFRKFFRYCKEQELQVCSIAEAMKRLNALFY